MADPIRRPATWQDLLALPEDVRAEVVGGELLFSPRARPIHSLVQTGLAADLAPPFGRGAGGPGGWWILIETEIELGPHDVVVPDLAGWRRERMPIFPTERPITTTPDWVCEIASPGTARLDRTRKANLYLASGIPDYWLVDPDERTLEALVAENGRWLRLGAWTDGDHARVAPFDAIELDIGVLFPPVE